MTKLVDQIKDTLGFLGNRRKAYRLAFGSPAGQEVLMDLVAFCRAASTTFHEDPRVSAALEGRREVFLRIQQHLNLTPEQLFSLYGGHTVQIVNSNED